MADVVFKVGGTDLELAGVRLMEVIEGAHAIPASRGDLPVFDGIDGVTDAEQPFEANTLSFGLLVNGGTRVGLNDALRTLRRLVKPGSTVTMTRELTYTSGTETHTATAKFAGLDHSQWTPSVYRVVLRMLILDGVWYGSAVTQAIANGNNTVTGVGDVRTHKMVITLTGGTTPTLFNSGYWVHFSGPMTSPVVIDTEAGTATQGATDVSEFLTWNQINIFQVKSGSHIIALTGGGSASISYEPAFL
jgi:hypothetical protein